MKVLSIFAISSLLVCGLQVDGHADAKFKNNKSVSYYHAQYVFKHGGYEDTEVALRITVSRGKPIMIELKDLTPPANYPVERLRLSANGSDFVGTSSGDVGGEYRIKLENGACCGEVTFVPISDANATF